MEQKEPKVSRSVRLNESVMARVEVVCECLGVNANAWIVNAIGQQLIRDESIMRMERASQETTEKALQGLFAELLPSLISEQTKDGSNESDD